MQHKKYMTFVRIHILYYILCPSILFSFILLSPHHTSPLSFFFLFYYLLTSSARTTKCKVFKISGPKLGLEWSTKLSYNFPIPNFVKIHSAVRELLLADWRTHRVIQHALTYTQGDTTRSDVHTGWCNTLWRTHRVTQHALTYTQGDATRSDLHTEWCNTLWRTHSVMQYVLWQC